MPFIKTQKIVRGEDGSIQSGSAAIVDTVYDKNSPKYHAKHTVRERLGKVLYLAEDKRSGIFSSPTRGLVFYSAAADRFDAVESNDPRISATYQPGPLLIHTVFGDTYLLLKFLEKQGLIPVLKSVFQKKKRFFATAGTHFSRRPQRWEPHQRQGFFGKIVFVLFAGRREFGEHAQRFCFLFADGTGRYPNGFLHRIRETYAERASGIWMLLLCRFNPITK